jgi:hypothetical protein
VRTDHDEFGAFLGGIPKDGGSGAAVEYVARGFGANCCGRLRELVRGDVGYGDERSGALEDMARFRFEKANRVNGPEAGPATACFVRCRAEHEMRGLQKVGCRENQAALRSCPSHENRAICVAYNAFDDTTSGQPVRRVSTADHQNVCAPSLGASCNGDVRYARFDEDVGDTTGNFA